jgi:hypothetical protein
MQYITNEQLRANAIKAPFVARMLQMGADEAGTVEALRFPFSDRLLLALTYIRCLSPPCGTDSDAPVSESALWATTIGSRPCRQ